MPAIKGVQFSKLKKEIDKIEHNKDEKNLNSVPIDKIRKISVSEDKIRKTKNEDIGFVLVDDCDFKTVFAIAKHEKKYGHIHSALRLLNKVG